MLEEYVEEYAGSQDVGQLEVTLKRKRISQKNNIKKTKHKQMKAQQTTSCYSSSSSSHVASATSIFNRKFFRFQQLLHKTTPNYYLRRASTYIQASFRLSHWAQLISSKPRLRSCLGAPQGTFFKTLILNQVLWCNQLFGSVLTFSMEDLICMQNWLRRQ